MTKLIIKGGVPLKGKVKPQGNKNSILPLMAAALLTDQDCILENVPLINDVLVMGEIMVKLGVKVEGLGTSQLVINASGLKSSTLPGDLVRKLRASILLLGPLLARRGEVNTVHPGGCLIGKRAVGTHFDALIQLGADIQGQADNYVAKVKQLRAADIFLDEASVTATENALFLASKISRGTTIIRDAACEPHVEEVCEVLKEMGCEIQGEGSNLLKIKGNKKLKGFSHRIWPDYIDVGSMAIAAAATKGEIEIEEIRPQDLSMLLKYLSWFGVKYQFKGNNLKIFPSELHSPPRDKKIQTRPWPGFPTDLMSPLVALATQVKGVTLCHDWMYEKRLFFVSYLKVMGAEITICDPHRVLVYGPTQLSGKKLQTPDIRAGMALVIAALCAKGESEIENIEILYRGYEKVTPKLKALGAQIKEVE